MRWFAGAGKRHSAYRVTDGKRLKKGRKKNNLDENCKTKEKEDRLSNSSSVEDNLDLSNLTVSSAPREMYVNQKMLYGPYQVRHSNDPRSPTRNPDYAPQNYDDRKGNFRRQQHFFGSQEDLGTMNKPVENLRKSENPPMQSQNYLPPSRENIAALFGLTERPGEKNQRILNPDFFSTNEQQKRGRFVNPPTKYIIQKDGAMTTGRNNNRSASQERGCDTIADDKNFGYDNEDKESLDSSSVSGASGDFPIKYLSQTEPEQYEKVTVLTIQKESEMTEKNGSKEMEIVKSIEGKQDDIKKPGPVPRPRPQKTADKLAKSHSDVATYYTEKPVVKKTEEKTLDEIKKNVSPLRKEKKSKSSESDVISDVTIDGKNVGIKKSNLRKGMSIESQDDHGNDEKINTKNEVRAQFKNSQESMVDEPFRSSMLWNGETSNRPPSSIDVYQTMPPNRYPQRKKDFMTQLRNNEEEDKNHKNSKEFKVHLDVNHYSPEEILVTLEDGKLVVNGKHFSESEYGFESCQFHRRYPIPDGIKKADIKSCINEDGILIITGKSAPTDAMAKPTPKARPITNYDNIITMPAMQAKKGSDSTETDSPPKSSPKPSENNIPKRHSPDGSPATHMKLKEDGKLLQQRQIVEDEFNELDDVFLLRVNCAGYSPDNMEVRVSRRELIVRGRKKIGQSGFGKESAREKEFSKRFTIPRQADCSSISSRFTDQEILYVECKKLKQISRRI